nr:hypothetical protein [uncultured Flavobacterium sp.]
MCLNEGQSGKTKILRLWLFTDKEAVTSIYDRKLFDIGNQINTFANIASPKYSNDGNALWVYQKTFFHLGIFDSNTTTNIRVKIPKNGVYLFLIEGEIEVNNQILKAKDAMGITDFDQFKIKIRTKSKTLLVEIPVNTVKLLWKQQSRWKSKTTLLQGNLKL